MRNIPTPCVRSDPSVRLVKQTGQPAAAVGLERNQNSIINSNLFLGGVRLYYRLYYYSWEEYDNIIDSIILRRSMIIVLLVLFLGGVW
jgi:hypothetical protein